MATSASKFRDDAAELQDALEDVNPYHVVKGEGGGRARLYCPPRWRGAPTRPGLELLARL
jgi:hypothetical protein